MDLLVPPALRSRWERRHAGPDRRAAAPTQQCNGDRPLRSHDWVLSASAKKRARERSPPPQPFTPAAAAGACVFRAGRYSRSRGSHFPLRRPFRGPRRLPMSRRALLAMLLAPMLLPPLVRDLAAQAEPAPEEVTIYRDDFGIPNIFAATEEG